jgi:cell wall-associated NlpC family hydrolase
VLAPGVILACSGPTSFRVRFVVPTFASVLWASRVRGSFKPRARARRCARGYGSGQAVVDDARSYIGTSYGAFGMDCSGFTSAVFADLGVYLPDSPDAQYAYGVPSNAKAGDLVFFDESGYGISHVGIATGYGTVIHASTYYAGPSWRLPWITSPVTWAP